MSSSLLETSTVAPGRSPWRLASPNFGQTLSFAGFQWLSRLSLHLERFLGMLVWGLCQGWDSRGCVPGQGRM